METIEPNCRLLRRNSTGTFDMNLSESKVMSRYLKASMASCHDLCKDGYKHPSVETKPISTFSARFSATRDNSQAISANSEQRFKKPLIAPKPIRDSKSETLVGREVVKREILASSKKDLSSKQDKNMEFKRTFSQKNSSTRSLSRRHSEIIIPKDFMVTEMHPKGDSSSKRNNKTEVRKDNTMTPRVIKKTDSVPQTVSASPKKMTARVSKKTVLTRQSVSTSPKASTKTVSSKNPGQSKSPRKLTKTPDQKNLPHLVLKKFRKSSPKKPIEETVPEKTLYVIEPNAIISTVASATSSENSSPTYEEKEASVDGHDVQTSLPFSPPLNDENPKNGDVENIATQYSSSLSLPSGSKDKNEDDLEYTKGKIQIKPIRIEKVMSEGKDCSPCKLKFSRGKEVHIYSENNSPKKLNFRQGKVLGENQSGKADKEAPRSVRRLVSDGELICTTTESEKIVLKHQDVEAKRESQSSFNNVIEETASKLIQTRKSKVKALVGAFENLISLHDTNSSK